MSANHLQNATSPYLLQHADNPVHWHPWGEVALNDEIRKRLTDKEYAFMAHRFSLDTAANFEGQWHFHCDADAHVHSLSGQQTALLNSAREKLFRVRDQVGDMNNWLKEFHSHYHPRRQIFAIPDTEQTLPEALNAKRADDKTVVYVCEGMSCSAPIREVDHLSR